jgi:tripartite-type tricarboxylate transporter receptor subunit TctC
MKVFLRCLLLCAAAGMWAPPDGYTLLQNSITTQGIGPYLFPKLPYDSFRDFAPVSLIATLPEIMTVSADMPVKSVDEFIALAKSKPGRSATRLRVTAARRT